jgi:hypothetical protein
MTDLGRCCNMREPKHSKLPPGLRKWRRCRNPADLLVDLHQDSEHPRVGNRWFEIALCDRCFKEGMDSR